MSAGTPWARGRLLGPGAGGPRLLFGRMYEDHGVERAVFPPGGRVLCIASAGDTTWALAAAGYEVTAVDINPVQVAYARARVEEGAPARYGTAERIQAVGRGLAGGLLPAWRREALRPFLALDDPAAQARWWRDRLDTPGLRRLMAVALRPGGAFAVALRPSFAGVVPARFDEVLRRRIERTVTTHPNASNPWLRRMLLGPDATPDAPRPAPVRWLVGDVAAVLEESPRHGYDAVTLSNVLDGPGPEFARRLRTAVRHAVRPDGVVVLRSAREPGREGPGWAVRDRSVLWGVVLAVRPGDGRIEP